MALRRRWLCLGLLLATAVAGAATSLQSGREGRYAALGDLPVKHRGRVKPLAVAALEEVETVHGRGPIRISSVEGGAETVWDPLAAVADWSARPEFWDRQEFVLVEDQTLARRLREGVRAAEARPPRAPRRVEDGGKGNRFAPRDLETAVIEREGRTTTFPRWVDELIDQREKGRDDPTGAAASLSDLEERAVEVGERLFHYQAVRDYNRPAARRLGLSTVPRPSDRKYLAFSAEAFRKGLDPDGALSPLEADAAGALVEYLEGLSSKEWALPGEDAQFDQKYAIWLAERSAWIPEGIVLGCDEAESARAGLPPEQVSAFIESRRALREAERAAPGDAPEAAQTALVAAARDLGTSLGAYAEPAATARESRLMRFAPLSSAQGAFGVAMALLVLSLSTRETSNPALERLSSASYGLGAASLALGAELVCYGLFTRFRVARWGPVANFHDSIVFFVLSAAALGLALELAWPRINAALAAAGVALLALAVAEHAPGLDRFLPEIPLPLRSNRWLVSHVPPIVAGYAAFGLGAGLGLLAVGCRLTVTDRRRPSYRELAWPILAGAPLVAVGCVRVAGVAAAARPPLFATVDPGWARLASASVAAAGGVLAMTGGFSVLGEFASRSPRRARFLGASLAAAGVLTLGADSSAAAREGVTAALGGVAWWGPGLTGVGLMILGASSARAEESSARIDALAGLILRLFLIGVPLLVLGAVMGGLWARRAWGRFWGWDPKEVGTLITLGVYLLPLYGRFWGRLSGFGLATASIACLLSVATSWYGLNFVHHAGLHTYGFNRSGGLEVVAGCFLASFSFVAAAWRRSRAAARPSPEPQSSLWIKNLSHKPA